MRELTQQEIDQAPKRFTYYCVKSNGGIHWQTKKECSGSQPIPRKQFDISEHEFSDDDESFSVNGDFIVLKRCDNYTNPSFDIHRPEAIALAKHFKLTADDLR